MGENDAVRRPPRRCLRWSQPRRRGPTARPRRRIIRARQYAVKPMSVEDAAVEIDDATDGFIVFRNSATDAVMVLFRRPDGNLGLIEPEA